MRVALHITFAASKKEPLAAMLDRVHRAFLTTGLGEPSIRFTFSDAPLAGFVSSVRPGVEAPSGDEGVSGHKTR